MYTVLITGTNSGIGLEFVKQYAKDNYNVIATYLNKASKKELFNLSKQFSNISLYALDVTNEKQIKTVANKLKNKKIDIFINNAGIWGQEDQDLKKITLNSMLKVFSINTVGPLLATKYFLKNILKSELKTLVSISSTLGSISLNNPNENFAGDILEYRTSKAALNMIMKSIYVDNYKKGLRVLLLHPCHVKTKIGGKDAPITPTTSVQGLRRVITKQKSSLEQFYFTYEGKVLNW